jgi:Flp pilus assembly protein TadG
MTPPSRKRAGGDGGSSVAELTLVLPALMLAVGLVVQLALWALAAHAVQAAAASGGDVARSLGGTRAAAIATARGELQAIGGALVASPAIEVAVSPGSGLATVSVGGTVPSLFPGLHLQVSATSVGPVGEFRGTG